MSTFLHNVALLIIQHVFLRQIIQIKSQGVCMSSTEFKAMCDKRNGFVYGAQCFFLASKPSNWSTGWSLCEETNATMAHLHNSKVYSYSYQTGVKISDEGVNFANRRYYQPDKMPRDVTQYYWHYSKTDYWTNLTWANTWVNRYSNNDANTVGEVLVIFLKFNIVGDGVKTFGKFWTMCEIWNFQQTFNTAVTGKCIAEQPILDLPAVDELGCCNICAQYMWCYTFNFVTSPSKKCQFFSWDLDDNPRLRTDANCAIYQNSD